MKRKLDCVLLIDDDEPTNFFNKMVVRQANIAEKLVVVDSGQEALDYLKSKKENEHPTPELIFLDINMPAMDGWEFLEYYKQLDKVQQGQVVVVMLTTTLNPDDKAKANEIDSVNGFLNKPLTHEMLQELVEQHFADRL